ncbi:hypothetical protein PYW07_011773 [Mythimna separata]|uniref:BPTI/Kunitz inhibitor domain-containing protein n=1 Tax=Mythimna separata TaxID=271217 RepID=A0AAD7Y789_MYTSE|nr:hypothetical protein PYW07_011773 [Mythimna separata]
MKLFGLLLTLFVAVVFAEINPICRQPAETGFCKALIPRYAYNSTSGSCQPFNYGGCGGNANNFRTRAECRMTCRS